MCPPDSSTRQRVIIVTGPPGAGKGTQCQELAQSIGLLHISTGDIFRDAVARGTDLGRRAQEFLQRGDFVPDAMAVELVRDRLAQPDARSGVLLDGFPRTAAQARQLVADVAVERLVLLQVPDETCVGRVLNRRIDPQTGYVYHLQNYPAPPSIAGRLVRREADLDTPAVRNRLRCYHACLGSVLPFFRGKIQAVNGTRAREEVAQDVARLVATPIAPLPEPEPAQPSAEVRVSVPTCAVCLDDPAEFLVTPCGHQCGCEACLTTVRRTDGRCPICRGQIDSIVRVYQCGIDAEEPQQPPSEWLEQLAVEDDGGWGADEEVPAVDAASGGLSVSVSRVDDAHVCVSVLASEESVVRQPVDVCCVVDVSYSMSSIAKYEDKDGNMKDDGLSYLDVVKHAVKTVMHTLGANDRLALVAFDDRAETAFALGEMTAGGRAQALAALDGLHPRGQTNLWDGLLAGMDTLRAPGGAKRTKSLLLLTDGQPNIHPPRGHIPELQAYKDQHPTFDFQINTFGFGYGLDSKLLLDLATAGGGSYGFIPDALIVGTNFVHAVANAMTTCAQTATLHLTPKNGATLTGAAVCGCPGTETSWGRALSIGPLQYGQRRDVVMPMTIPDSVSFLEAVVVVPDGMGGERRASAVGDGPAVGSTLALAQLLRSEAATTILKAVADAGSNRGQAANQAIAALAGKVAAYSAGAERRSTQDVEVLQKLHTDIAGRVTKALSTKERFNRWGKHYMLALARSHQVQLCTNFMDPGLQVYGGELFKQLKEEGGRVFLELPPPQPQRAPSARPQSRQSRTSAQSATSRVAAAARPAVTLMTTYYAGSGGGCFGGSSSVSKLSAEGADVWERVAVRDVRAGDVLRLAEGFARVRCVVCITRPGPLVRLGALTITPRHPVRIDGKWQRPCDLGCEEPNPDGCVFNFVLDCFTPGWVHAAGHGLMIDGIECVIWGHDMDDPAVQHPFYGTARVIREVAALPGWNEGFVHVRGVVRDERNNVVSFLSEAPTPPSPVLGAVPLMV